LSDLPRAYRWIVAFLRLLVRCFFRRVEVVGLDSVPAEGGGIVVSWHPNGLVDPALILTSFPRQVVFGARSGLFKMPLIGTLVRSIGTVPILRAMDLPNMTPAERVAANAKSLDALAARIAGGAFSALFPEGTSHDAPHLIEMKAGAARLYYQARARQPAGEPASVILPVGLHYDDKDLFRSNAMVEFAEPMVVPPELEYAPGWDEATLKEKAKQLTAEIERVLRDVVLATDSWELYGLMHRARKLVRAERAHRAGADPGASSIGERVLGFARIRAAYNARLAKGSDDVERLVKRVEEYDADLRALGIEDHELDRAPRRGRAGAALLLALQVLAVYFILPPLLVIGYAVNAPGALALLALNAAVRKHKKDEATVKLLVGALLFPLSWLAAGLAATRLHVTLHDAFPSIPNTPVLAGVMVGLLAAIGGAVAVRYLRRARETARALRVRMTRWRRSRSLERLRAERAALCNELLAVAEDVVAEGVALPGEVAADGRIVAE
jgi:1-acyl-sn-glycerol-3-phosphate acyltransferase